MTPKFSAALVAVAACLAVPAHADIVTYTGDTTGAPTYNRLLEDLSDLSLTGTDTAYARYAFTVDTSGMYTFLSTAGYDNFSFLYGGSFDAAAPLANALAGNDDLLTTTTSGFAWELDAGQTYVFVHTGFGNGDFGAFSTTIGGPGAIAAVPEPGSWALLALGLAGLSLVARRGARRR